MYNIHSVVPVTPVIDGGSKWLGKLRNGKTAFCCVFIYSSIKNIFFPVDCIMSTTGKQIG